MNKTVFFAFRGDPMCFIHVLLNGLDLHEKGMDGKIILEGEATTLIPQIAEPGHFLHKLYLRAREADLIVGACKACAAKMKVDKAIEAEGIALIGEMSGHPAMSEYINQGFTVLTF